MRTDLTCSCVSVFPHLRPDSGCPPHSLHCTDSPRDVVLRAYADRASERERDPARFQSVGACQIGAQAGLKSSAATLDNYSQIIYHVISLIREIPFPHGQVLRVSIRPVPVECCLVRNLPISLDDQRRTVRSIPTRRLSCLLPVHDGSGRCVALLWTVIRLHLDVDDVLRAVGAVMAPSCHQFESWISRVSAPGFHRAIARSSSALVRSAVGAGVESP